MVSIDGLHIEISHIVTKAINKSKSMYPSLILPVTQINETWEQVQGL